MNFSEGRQGGCGRTPRTPPHNPPLLSTTRRNKYKLQKSESHYNLRKFSFCLRVVNIWNSLSDSVIDADMLNTFKSLGKHWLDQDVLYNFHSELTGTGGASVCM